VILIIDPVKYRENGNVNKWNWIYISNQQDCIAKYYSNICSLYNYLVEVNLSHDVYQSR